jgi:hypothetical protein
MTLSRGLASPRPSGCPARRGAILLHSVRRTTERVGIARPATCRARRSRLHMGRADWRTSAGRAFIRPSDGCPATSESVIPSQVAPTRCSPQRRRSAQASPSPGAKRPIAGSARTELPVFNRRRRSSASATRSLSSPRSGNAHGGFTRPLTVDGAPS